MKKYKSFIISVVIISLLTPSIAFASWWNPISWFKNEDIKITSVEVSTSTQTEIAKEIPIKSNWYNPVSWFKKENTSQKDFTTTTKNILTNKELEIENKESEKSKLEMETAKAKAEAEKYKLQAEQTRLEIEKIKQQNQAKTQQTEPKKEESKNSIVTLPNGAVLEMDEYGNMIRTIKKAPQVLPIPTQQIQQNNYNSERESCLASHYSRAEIQATVDEIKAMYENTVNESKARINSTYNKEISDVKNQGEQKLTSAREAQRGFGTNTAYLNQIISDTKNSVEDLEQIRDELLSSIQTTLSQQLSELKITQLEFERESEEVKCY